MAINKARVKKRILRVATTLAKQGRAIRSSIVQTQVSKEKVKRKKRFKTKLVPHKIKKGKVLYRRIKIKVKDKEKKQPIKKSDYGYKFCIGNF